VKEMKGRDKLEKEGMKWDAAHKENKYNSENSTTFHHHKINNNR